MLRRIPSQLQAHRSRHQAEREKGPSVSPSQWSVSMSCPSFRSINPLAGVVSAPLWNSERSKFAGMLTVSDIIHLIQYYYDNSSYDTAAADVETFRLESLRGLSPSSRPVTPLIDVTQTLKKVSGLQPRLCFANIRAVLSTMQPNCLSRLMLDGSPFSIMTPRHATKSWYLS